ncbi:nhaD, partial [Symbiodinium natans]
MPSEVEKAPSGRQELPIEPKLAGRHLPSLLIQAFGMQVADNVEELQQMLASGQGFRKTATSEATGEGSETATISFKEFLILARRTREMEMLQLSQEMPGMLNTPSTAAKGDFENADTDGNGTISDKELVKFLEGKEFTPLKKVVQEVLMEVAAEAIQGQQDL